MPGPTEIEKENLEAHVALCAERYKQLENQLGTIEDKVNDLHETIQKSHLNTIKVLIGTAGTVIVGVLSLFGIMISKFPY